MNDPLGNLTMRAKDIPLPRGLNALFSALKKIIHLPNVAELRVTPGGISVTRAVAAGEEVLPDTLDDYTSLEGLVMAVLEKVTLTTIEPLEGGLLPTALEAFNLIGREGLVVTGVVAPWDSGSLRDALGAKEPPTHFFGAPVYYELDDSYHAQCIVLGGTSHLIDDYTRGVSFPLEVK